MFYFHPYLGRWSNLTNMFQLGWNHQLEKCENILPKIWVKVKCQHIICRCDLFSMLSLSELLVGFVCWWCDPANVTQPHQFGQMWSQDVSGVIPPLVLHYYRTVLRGKMSGGISREAMTIAYLCDLTLQGRVAEAMDVGLQRLKSLELTSNGADYRVKPTHKELLPQEMRLWPEKCLRHQDLDLFFGWFVFYKTFIWENMFFLRLRKHRRVTNLSECE